MKGTLSDFRLAEILQLVAVQQKTGLLRVQSRDRTLTFYFDHGLLVSTRDRRNRVEDPLLDYLRRTGWIDAAVARQLASELRAEPRDLAELVIERQYIGEDELLMVLEDLAQELIYRSQGWNEGSYQFIAGEHALAGLGFRISRGVEGLLMEAARRADEWPNLVRRIPSPDAVLAPIAVPPTSLDPRTHELLSRLDRPMRMRELVAQARVPEYDVYETLVAALDAGLTELLEVPRPEPEPTAAEVSPAKPRRKARSPRARPGAFGALVGALAIAVTLASLSAGWLLRERADRAVAEVVQPVHRVEARQRLLHALEVYRALHGRYPPSLDVLAATRTLAPGWIEAAGVAGYAPRRTDGPPRLTWASPGASD